MKRYAVLALIILITSCEKDRSPLKHPDTGTIELTIGDSSGANRILPDSPGVAARFAGSARVNKLEVRVLKSDNTQITSKIFTPSGGYFEGSVEIEARNDLKVLCIGTNNNVVERFGIDEDVDVLAGKTTTAEIYGWDERFIPVIDSITPSPSPDGSYTVFWNHVPNAVHYILQEANNSRLGGIGTVYSGSEPMRGFSGMIPGTYYYRVLASNEYGDTSGWSNVLWVTVSGTGEWELKGKITFVSNRDSIEEINDEIYVMNADGTNQIRLTYNSWRDSNPAWSPDGLKIAFDSHRNNNTDIYVMDTDGSNQTNLTNNTVFDAYPAWSPDGLKIAFESTVYGVSNSNEIYVIYADGSNQTRLTNNPANFEPAWSPDGSRIAFVSNRDGNSEIYVMNADGSNQIRLTDNPAQDSSPAWSPNGSRIAFHSNRNGNSEIYVMNTDGSNQIRLTNNPAFDSYPAWSPDGSQIAFESGRDGNSEIYVMDANGTNQTRLTNHPADDYYPSWSPF